MLKMPTGEEEISSTIRTKASLAKKRKRSFPSTRKFLKTFEYSNPKAWRLRKSPSKACVFPIYTKMTKVSPLSFVIQGLNYISDFLIWKLNMFGTWKLFGNWKFTTCVFTLVSYSFFVIICGKIAGWWNGTMRGPYELCGPRWQRLVEKFPKLPESR